VARECLARLREGLVLDIVLLLVVVVFFAIAWAYTAACDRI
jgi:hypothetical protein